MLYAVSAVGLVLALGETRLLNATDAPGLMPPSQRGVLLYAPGLLLVALSSWASRWVRATGAATAVLFAAHTLSYFGGRTADSTGPLASIGYGLLTVTIAGWVITILRSPRS